MTLLPVVQTTWEQWRRMRPETQVVLTSSRSGHRFRYRRSPTSNDQANEEPGEFDLVLGVESGDAVTAYPFRELAQADGPISDRVGKSSIQVHFDKASNSAWATDQDGHLIAALTAYWNDWQSAYPNSRAYDVPLAAAP